MIKVLYSGEYKNVKFKVYLTRGMNHVLKLKYQDDNKFYNEELPSHVDSVPDIAKYAMEVIQESI